VNGEHAGTKPAGLGTARDAFSDGAPPTLTIDDDSPGLGARVARLFE
jgi:hypothetical protein